MKNKAGSIQSIQKKSVSVRRALLQRRCKILQSLRGVRCCRTFPDNLQFAEVRKLAFRRHLHQSHLALAKLFVRLTSHAGLTNAPIRARLLMSWRDYMRRPVQQRTKLPNRRGSQPSSFLIEDRALGSKAKLPFSETVKPVPIFNKIPDSSPQKDLKYESSSHIFVRTVRHELLTPLSAIVGMLDLIDSKGLLDPTGKLCVKYAKESAQSLVGHLLAILEFTSLIENQPILTLSNQPLAKILQELATVWQARAEAKGLKLLVRIQPGHYVSARVDVRRLRRLIEILVSNAIKFTHYGEITLGLSAGPELWVKDTGIGISNDLHESIFHPFMQIDGSTARKDGGMGLSLAIAQHLANAMEAKLSVTSTLGEGSQFTLKLPAIIT